MVLLMQLWLVTARVPLASIGQERRQLEDMGISSTAFGPVGHAAPCDDGTGGLEVACLGGPAYMAANPDAVPWCCSTINYWCGVNSTGAPRCAVCPAICIMSCDTTIGERCLLDRGCSCRPGGCSRCLQSCATAPCAAGTVCLDGYCHTDPCTEEPCAGTPGAPVCQLSANFTTECVPGPECGDATPCPQGKACADGSCIADPCYPNPCPAEAPDCVVAPGPGLNATCIKRCSDADPCPTAQFCANSTCRPNPCIGFECPSEAPQCIVGRAPGYLPYCITTGEIAGGANCKPACSRPDVCQQMGSTKRWRCAPPRPTPSLPRRRQPLLKPRQAAAAATAAAAAAVDPDVDGGEESGDGPGFYGKRATAAVDGSEQGRGPEGESGDPGLPSPQA